MTAFGRLAVVYGAAAALLIVAQSHGQEQSETIRVKFELPGSACLGTDEAGKLQAQPCDGTRGVQNWKIEAGKLQSKGKCMDLTTLAVGNCFAPTAAVDVDPSGRPRDVASGLCLGAKAETGALALEDCAEPEGAYRVGAPAKFKVRNAASDACLNHELRFEPCSPSAVAQLWHAEDGRFVTAPGERCLQLGSAGPQLVPCQVGQEDLMQVIINQFGRLAGFAGQCVEISGDGDLAYGGSCQGPADENQLLEIATAGNLLLATNSTCVGRDPTAAAAVLVSDEACATAWSFDGRRLQNGGLCLDFSDNAKASLTPCRRQASRQRVTFDAEGHLIVQSTGACVDAATLDVVADTASCTPIDRRADLCRGFEESENATEPELTKASACCTKDAPCGQASGVCDNDSQCAGGLVCGKGNCLFEAGANCCELPAPACQVSTVAELAEQITTCPTGRIELLRDLVWRVGQPALVIPPGKTVEIVAAENAQSGSSDLAGRASLVRLSMRAATRTFFDVQGVLLLEDINLFRGDVRVSGATARLELADCELELGQAVLLQAASLEVFGGELVSRSGSAVAACGDCAVELMSVRVDHRPELPVPAATPAVTGGKVVASGLKLSPGALLVGDGAPKPELLDVRRSYVPNNDCTELVLLEEAGPQDILGCEQACDANEACAAYRFLQFDLSDPDEPKELLSCELFSAASDCSPASEDNSLSFHPVRVVEDSLADQFERFTSGHCVNAVDVLTTVSGVATSQECRTWCTYYADCKALRLSSDGKCFLASKATACAFDAAPVELAVASDYLTVAVGCPADPDVTAAGACGTLCDMAGPSACVGVLEHPDTGDCQLLRALPDVGACSGNATASEVGDYQLRVSPRAAAATFPKQRMVRARGVCPAAPESRTWRKVFERTGCVTTFDLGKSAVDDLWGQAASGLAASDQVVRFDVDGLPAAFYKRLVPAPGTFSLYDNLVGTWGSVDNALGVDMVLYSTEADLQRDAGRWTYCNYDSPDIGFPRDCGPTDCSFGVAPASASLCAPDGGSFAFYVMEPRDTSSNLDDCERICRADETCVAVALPDGGTCTFHSTNDLAPCGAGIEMSLTIATTDLAELLPEAVVDDVGRVNNDLELAAVLLDSTPDACRAACDLSPTCSKLFFEQATSTCHLESADATEPFAFAGDAEVILSELEESSASELGSFEYAAGAQPFAKILEVTNADAATCGLVCDNLASCRAWHEKGRICALYAGVNVPSSSSGSGSSGSSSGGVAVSISARPFAGTDSGDDAVLRDYIDAGTLCDAAGALDGAAELALEARTGLDSEASCLALCEATQDCETAMFAEETNSCRLFSVAVQPGETRNAACEPGQVTGGLRAADSQFDFARLPLPGLCLAGPVFESLVEVTMEACKQACQRDNGHRCLSVTYDYADATCSLHLGIAMEPCGSEAALAPSKAQMISTHKYVDEDFSFLRVPTAEAACPAEPGFGVLATLADRSLTQCRRRCELNPRCQAIVYRAAARSCELRDGNDFATGAAACAEAGLAQPEDAFELKYVPDKYTEAGKGQCAAASAELASLAAAPEVCAALCDGLEACLALSYRQDDGLCTLHDALESRLLEEGESCSTGTLYVTHTVLYFTADSDGKCGAAPLATPGEVQVTLDACKALCRAQHETCHGFNFDPRTLACQLQGDTFDQGCGAMGAAACTNCTGTLHVAFRPPGAADPAAAFEYVRGKTCHGGEVPPGLEAVVRGASTERCKALCSANSKCRAVSMLGGVCQFSTAFSLSSVCPEVHLKLRQDRFGRLLNVLRGAAPVESYEGKSPAECTALCQAKQGCVNVAAPCVDGDEVAALTCDLMGRRDLAGDDDEDLDIVECDASRRDVFVHETRHIFDQVARSAVCRDGRGFRVAGEFRAASQEDCAELCHAMEADCRAVSFAAADSGAGAALATRAGVNCVALTVGVEVPTADLFRSAADGCADAVDGAFFPKARPAGTLDDNTLAVRLFLRSPNGRVGREALRLVKAVERRVGAKADKVEALARSSLGVLSAFLGPFGVATNAAAVTPVVAGVLGAFDVGLSLGAPLFGAVPVVGGVVKFAATKLAKACGGGSKMIKGVGKKLAKLISKVGRVLRALGRLNAVLLSAATAVAGLGPAMLLATNVLVTAHKCAFDAGRGDLIESIEEIFGVVTRTANDLVDAVDLLGAGIFGTLNRLRRSMSAVLPDLNGLFKGLNFLRGFMNPFRWLITLVNFRICMPVVGCFGLRTIANIVRKLTGFLGFVLKPLKRFVSRLIPDLRLPLPDLSLSLFSFLDPLTDLVEQAIAAVAEEAERIVGFVQDRAAEIVRTLASDTMLGLFDFIADAVAQALACQGIDCLLGPMDLPSIPEELVDAAQSTVETMTDLVEAVQVDPAFTDAMFGTLKAVKGCAKSEPLPLEAVGQAASMLGLNDTAMCSATLANLEQAKFCTEFEIDEDLGREHAEALEARLSELLPASARRRLAAAASSGPFEDAKGNPIGFHLTWAIPFDLRQCDTPEFSFYVSTWTALSPFAALAPPTGGAQVTVPAHKARAAAWNRPISEGEAKKSAAGLAVQTFLVVNFAFFPGQGLSVALGLRAHLAGLVKRSRVGDDAPKPPKPPLCPTNVRSNVGNSNLQLRVTSKRTGVVKPFFGLQVGLLESVVVRKDFHMAEPGALGNLALIVPVKRAGDGAVQLKTGGQAVLDGGEPIVKKGMGLAGCVVTAMLRRDPAPEETFLGRYQACRDNLSPPAPRAQRFPPQGYKPLSKSALEKLSIDQFAVYAGIATSMMKITIPLDDSSEEDIEFKIFDNTPLF